MRSIESLPESEGELRQTEGRVQRLSSWLRIELEDALSSRHDLEAVWRECQRMYDGAPKNPIRNTPVEGAPNVEVPLGAIASDSIYAQIVDLVHNTKPTLTVRANRSDRAKHARALQKFINWMTENELGLRNATDNAFLDHVQLGTGIYYIPWTRRTRRTNADRVVMSGPEIIPVPVEDFLVPGGARGDLQKEPWVAMRVWMTRGELKARSKTRGWDIEKAQPTSMNDWVRSAREKVAHQEGEVSRKGKLYEIWEIYCYFDWDNDGQEEDLLVTWDRTSGQILKVRWNPFDRRPFEVSRYQVRAHMFYGLGVMEMLKNFQYEATEIHNQRVLNSLLVNSRCWIVDEDALVDPDVTIVPGGLIYANKTDAIRPWPMADQFPSAFADESVVLGLAERRSGVGDLSLPRQSAIMGSRTPATTALTMMQNVNRRFTPAFDAARLAVARAVQQALYRYQEKLLSFSGSSISPIVEHIYKVLGPERGELVVQVLKDQDFGREYEVEITASSASINRESDKQSAIMLVNLLVSYYEKTLTLIQIASSPETSEPVKDVARQIAEKSGEMIERTLNTFEFVRDPERFAVEMEGLFSGMAGISQAGPQGQGVDPGMAEPPGQEVPPEPTNGRVMVGGSEG